MPAVVTNQALGAGHERQASLAPPQCSGSGCYQPSSRSRARRAGRHVWESPGGHVREGSREAGGRTGGAGLAGQDW